MTDHKLSIRRSFLNAVSNDLAKAQKVFEHSIRVFDNIDDPAYTIVGNSMESEYNLVTIGDDVYSKYGDHGIITNIEKCDDDAFDNVTFRLYRFDTESGENIVTDTYETLSGDRLS